MCHTTLRAAPFHGLSHRHPALSSLISPSLLPCPPSIIITDSYQRTIIFTLLAKQGSLTLSSLPPKPYSSFKSLFQVSPHFWTLPWVLSFLNPQIKPLAFPLHTCPAPKWPQLFYSCQFSFLLHSPPRLPPLNPPATHIPWTGSLWAQTVSCSLPLPKGLVQM